MSLRTRVCSRRGVIFAAPPLLVAAGMSAALGVSPAGAQSGTSTVTTLATQTLPCPGQAVLAGETVSCDGSGAGQVKAILGLTLRKAPPIKTVFVELDPLSGVTFGPASIGLGADGATSDSATALLTAPGSTGTVQTTTVNLTINGDNAFIAAAVKRKKKPPVSQPPKDNIQILSFSW